MKLTIKIIAVIMAVTLTGCHSKKTTYTGNLQTAQNSTTDTGELFEQMAASYSAWHDLYVPVTFTLNEPKSFSVSGRATMIYGKEINISLRMLGMEVGVVYINESTLYVVDKFHKMYLQEDIADILSGYELTITDIQNLLLGRITSFGHGEITGADAKDFTFLSSDSSWILTPKKQRKGTDLNYIATMTAPPILSDILLRIKDKGVVSFSYTEPTETPAGVVAGIMTISAPLKDTMAEAAVTFNLNDAKWDEGRTINFKAPSNGYTRLSAEDLLKTL